MLACRSRKAPAGASLCQSEFPMVKIREHCIPSAGSKPYIAVAGPDGALWFCESGAGKIGRFDPDRRAFAEFALPAPDATPIGITPGADGNLWFAEKAANRIGRITLRGAIAEFALPTPNAGPDGIMLGPDGNVWFSETEVSRIGMITPGRPHQRIWRRHHAGIESRCRLRCVTARCGSARPPATASAASPSTAR